MLALSVHQPWAHLIVQGRKPVENRTWYTRYRGPLAIHASQSRMTLAASIELAHVRAALRDLGLTTTAALNSLDFGALVGVVDLVDCLPVDAPGLRDRRFDDWAMGPYCWVLENARAIPPIPTRGRQGLFQVAGN